MNERIKVIDEELSDKPRSINGLEEYAKVRVLARIHGTPLGWVHVPVINGKCPASLIRKMIIENYSLQILKHLLENKLSEGPLGNLASIDQLFNRLPRYSNMFDLLITVVVCTRNRTDNLKLCLDSLINLDYPYLDLIVIDNAPNNQDTEWLVKGSYPNVRYIREDCPGLNWARNRAVLEARGDVIAYTDDDAIVDKRWVASIAEIFYKCPEVMAVTGLVVPYELETKAQNLFELYGGFDRGFKRKWAHLDNYSEKNVPVGTGQFGTGANMAFRRSVFDRIGLFDPALDVGTVTNGGGDLEMFFRVLKEGYSLVYEPRAIVRHRHRTDYDSLKSQIRNNGIGFYSYLVRTAIAYPEKRFAIARFGLWWFWWWSIRRLLLSFWCPMRLPRDLILAELVGSIIGLGRYFKARRNASKIASAHNEKIAALNEAKKEKLASTVERKFFGTGVCKINLSQPLKPIINVSQFSSLQIYVLSDEKLFGYIRLTNNGNLINTPILIELITEQFGLKLLDHISEIKMDFLRAKAMAALYQHYMPSEKEEKLCLPDNISVSVVVATYDRPDELRQCLESLISQKTNRQIEIIVVDNHPASGKTPPVIFEFPGVIVVDEKRKGLSYARNAGIAISTGDIVITADDDVIAPSDWLEKLVAPFRQSRVMVVTGNVLPYELNENSQRLFEMYGGLGKGFNELEADQDWFESFKRDAVPTWNLGATANAAFRRDIFTDPEIGLFDELLGAGMPTGCSEDTLIFYDVLKNGYTIKYEPSAYVWHKHRKDMKAFQRQIYNYSKGHVAYNLLTFIRNFDCRALFRIMWHLPRWHAARIYKYFKARLKKRHPQYPLKIILCEIFGNLAGPLALIHSWYIVKRQGKSNAGFTLHNKS